MGASVGELLRDWRVRRRMSQLDLSVAAEVSGRHLSFLETGRSKPSREMVLHLAGHLDVPLRDRNALLVAAGFSPEFHERRLDDAELAPVKAAMDTILEGHDPFPAVVVDRRHDLVAANRSAQDVFVGRLPPELLEPPVNALRVTLHPDGLARDIVNLEEYGGHLLAQLDREIAASGDASLVALAEELRALPGMATAPPPPDAASQLFVPLVLRSDAGELRFFSTIATFGTALDVTVAELSIESFFPADAGTAAALSGRAAPGARGGG